MKQIGNLITPPPGVSAEPTNNDTRAAPSQLTERHIEILWERMAKIFGHKWVSSYGETDDGTWLSGLHDITVDQVKNGLERLRVGAKEWPPTLPEFRALCLPPMVPPYHVPYRRLPEKETDWNKQLACLAKVRAVLNKGEKIDVPKDTVQTDDEAKLEREAIQSEGK